MSPYNVQFKKRFYQKNFGGKLFTWKELEHLINIRPLMDEKRVLVLNDEKFRWNDNDVWTINPDCYPPTLLKELIETQVCYIKEMSRATEKINAFAAQLEKIYRLPTDAHIYSCKNPDLKHPFGIHFDESHNVIVQCEGKTNFKVWDKVRGKEQNNCDMKLNEDPLLDVEMNSGDASWIPAYYPHLATSRTSRLSVSFPSTELNDPFLQNRQWVKL